MLSIDYRDPLLINTVGHSVGILVFGAMAVLLVKDWRHNGFRQTRLSLTAALLAFFWNLGSLLVLAASGHESLALEALVTFSFSILGLLPAVLLHIVLRQRRLIWVAGGYGFCRTRRSWSGISSNAMVSCSEPSSMCCFTI